MRSKIVAGNWKMNKTYQETKSFVKELTKEVKKVKLDNTRVIIAPSFTNLQKASKKTKRAIDKGRFFLYAKSVAKRSLCLNPRKENHILPLA